MVLRIGWSQGCFLLRGWYIVLLDLCPSGSIDISVSTSTVDCLLLTSLCYIFLGLQEVKLVLHFLSTSVKDVCRILSVLLLCPLLASETLSLLHVSVIWVRGGESREYMLVMPRRPLSHRRMKPRPSLWYMSPSSALEEEDYDNTVYVCHASPSSAIQVDVPEASLCHAVEEDGGTPRNPLLRRTAPVSSLCHASPVSIPGNGAVCPWDPPYVISFILHCKGSAPGPLSVMSHVRCHRGSVPWPLSVTSLCPPLQKRMSVGLSTTEVEVSKILSLS